MEMMINDFSKKRIALLDQKTPLWTIFNSSNIYTPYNKFPTIEQLKNAASVVVLAELVIRYTHRSSCEGLASLREIRFWNKVKCPIVLISFLTKNYLTSKPEWKRLFKLADEYIQLPTTLSNIEENQIYTIEDLNKRFYDFCSDNLDSELKKLLGSVNHPSSFYRNLCSLYISPNEDENGQFLNKLDTFVYLLKMKENNIKNILQQITEVRIYFSGQSNHEPSINNIQYWVENKLWREG